MSSSRSGLLAGRLQALPRSASRFARVGVMGPLAIAIAIGAAACTGTSPTSSGAAQSPARLQGSYQQVVQHVLPSVVQITTGTSTGSGVVYDSNGDVVTNAHVVGDATDVTVREPIGTREMHATVVGTFPPDDLAVVRVQGNTGSLKPATFANSDDVKVGQIVLAMGNPLGLTDSVTQGIVSATGRTVGEGGGSIALITAAIQTSAAINPGNSGGALVNLGDQVVGIPTLSARLPEEGGAAPGIGFAIPSDTVRNIAGQLIKDGKVTRSDRAALGITGQNAASSTGEPAGVAVVTVESGGTAASAGVRPGDVIVGLNTERVFSMENLQTAVALIPPGTRVTIHYTRGGSATVHSGTGTLGSLGSSAASTPGAA
ncbi:MAG: trypsin-like peptidase domain-containing protein [Actinobacteria bacterium]|nr:trypsin-like peptidase domain-containing protein [Actinomycetota bacterium]MBO0836954.1 trypsin-like peptidase domain-containing protein [Actinomycetota bacterium]